MESRFTSNNTQVLTLLTGRSGVFAVCANKKFVVVDTSTHNYRTRLFSRIDELLAQDNEFVGLVLTHAHFDHVGNAAECAQHYQVPLIIHESEAAYLKKGESPEVRGAFVAIKAITSTFKSLIERSGRFDPAEPSITFSETFSLHELGIPAVLHHTPGHTLGSSTLVVDDEIALAGDTLFGIVPGRVFPPFVVDEKLLLQSWEKLLEIGCSCFLPAHGDTRTHKQLAEGLAKRRKP